MAILNVFAGSGGGVRIPLETPTGFVATPASGKILLSWTDPVDKVANPGGEAVATWNYTIVVRKVGSAPQTPGDGVEIVREHTRNQYQSTTYTDELYIENGITYHYAVFAVSTIGVWSTPATATAMPRAETFSYHDSIVLTFPSPGKYATTASHTTNHALFTNILTDWSGPEEYTNSVLAVNKEGTQTNLTGEKAVLSAGGSVDGYAFFAGGHIYADNPFWISSSGSNYTTSTVTVFSPSLSKSTTDLLYGLDGAMGIASASISDRIIFAGGHTEDEDAPNGMSAKVRSFTSSRTRYNLSDLSNARGYAGGASTSNHAIFAGGFSVAVLSDVSNSGIAYNYVDAYDSSFTKVSSIANLSVSRGGVGATTVGSTAVFAGGRLTGGDTFTNVVEGYNDSLTKISLDSLSSSRYAMATVSMGGTAIFAGGSYSNYTFGHSSRPETTTRKNVDKYTPTLTKETLPNLNYFGVLSGAMAENIAVFAGDEGNADRYIYQ